MLYSSLKNEGRRWGSFSSLKCNYILHSQFFSLELHSVSGLVSKPLRNWASCRYLRSSSVTSLYGEKFVCSLLIKVISGASLNKIHACHNVYLLFAFWIDSSLKQEEVVNMIIKYFMKKIAENDKLYWRDSVIVSFYFKNSLLVVRGSSKREK